MGEFTDGDGNTALILAGKKGHLDILRELLDRGANIEAQDKWQGNTALQYAAQNNHLEVVKELLDRGANIEAQGKWQGNTALHYAARYNRLDVVKVLLDRGANVRTKNADGETALKLARQKGHTEIVRVLQRALDLKKSPNVFGYLVK